MSKKLEGKVAERMIMTADELGDDILGPPGALPD
jgi:hypothetical protein